ncbi:MAG: hypothetical protein Q7W16_02290 [Coriobacteriia bacterium]|nr:hypothetical protein [Coriobacteriia bacterium]
MTPQAKTANKAAPVRRVPSAQRITTDDLRHKALAVRDMTTDEARHLLERNRVRLIIGSAVVVAVALSAAYYFGSRSGARAARKRRR